MLTVVKCPEPLMLGYTGYWQKPLSPFNFDMCTTIYTLQTHVLSAKNSCFSVKMLQKVSMFTFLRRLHLAHGLSSQTLLLQDSQNMHPCHIYIPKSNMTDSFYVQCHWQKQSDSLEIINQNIQVLILQNIMLMLIICPEKAHYNTRFKKRPVS